MADLTGLPDGAREEATLDGVAERFAHRYESYGPKRKNRSRYLELRPGLPVRRILIKGIQYVITPDEDDQVVVWENRSLLVEGPRIQAILGPDQLGEVNLNEVDLVYDAQIRGGLVVTPGFVNAHAHPPMYLLRSSTALDREEGPIEEVLQRMVHLERMMTREEAFLSAVGDLSEQQKMGTTTVLSHYHLPGLTARAAHVVGERLVDAISLASATRPDAGPSLAESFIETVEDDGLVTPALALHSAHRTPDATAREAARLQAEKGLLLTAHCAESVAEVEACLQAHGVGPLEFFDRHGLLGERLLLSHAVHLTEEQIDRIARLRVGVVHLPTSNKIHRSGDFRYELFHRLGAIDRVALGTDSVISKNRLGLLTEALQARTLHQHTGRVRYDDLFRMVTSNGARVLGLPDVGRVLPGYRADLAIWKLRDRGFLPYDEGEPRTLIGNMITHGGRTVRDLMVGGEFVIVNRVHAKLNESKLLSQLQSSHMALRARVTEEAMPVG